MNTKKLLIIYPSTFIWKDNRQVVMYNSQSHLLYYFLCNEITEYYCDHLLDMTNLYVIEIEESHITNGNLIDYIISNNSKWDMWMKFKKLKHL